MIPRVLVLTVKRQINRFDETVKHLDEEGIKWERFDGFDNQVCRLQSKDSFDLDRAGERLEAKHVAATLTHWAAWKVMSYQPDDSFWCLEFDVRMVEGWRERYELAMRFLPDDWDIVFLGSCCTKGRPMTPVLMEVGSSGAANDKLHTGLYDVRYPLCGHAIMYRKKCLETLLTVHQKINMPLDIAMFYNSLPKLRVYTVLPSIIGQHATILPP